jgi:hypothetical protein
VRRQREVVHAVGRRLAQRARQQVGREPDVAVAEEQPLARGQPAADVLRVALADPARRQRVHAHRHELADLRAQPCQQRGRLVARAVVDRDDLEAHAALRRELPHVVSSRAASSRAASTTETRASSGGAAASPGGSRRRESAARSERKAAASHSAATASSSALTSGS